MPPRRNKKKACDKVSPNGPTKKPCNQQVTPPPCTSSIQPPPPLPPPPPSTPCTSRRTSTPVPPCKGLTNPCQKAPYLPGPFVSIKPDDAPLIKAFLRKIDKDDEGGPSLDTARPCTGSSTKSGHGGGPSTSHQMASSLSNDSKICSRKGAHAYFQKFVDENDSLSKIHEAEDEKRTIKEVNEVVVNTVIGTCLDLLNISVDKFSNAKDSQRKKYKIAVDVDEVIAHFHETLQQYVKEIIDKNN